MLSLIVLSLVAGCGGGGGGGGGSSSGSTAPTTLTIDGTVTNAIGAGIAGAVVTETEANVSATCGSTGTFSMTLPSSTSGTTATFDVYDSNQLLQIVQVKITATVGETQNIGTVSTGPPAPP